MNKNKVLQRMKTLKADEQETHINMTRYQRIHHQISVYTDDHVVASRLFRLQKIYPEITIVQDGIGIVVSGPSKLFVTQRLFK